MLRYAKLLFGALLAVVVMGAAAQGASALSVSVAGGTSTATITGLTLRDSVLGNVLGNLTLTFSVAGRTYSVDGSTYTVGAVTAGAGVITTPSGLTLTLNTPWNLTSDGTLIAGGGLQVRISGISFTLRSALSTLNYTGSITGTLNAAGNSLSVTASSFTRGTATASFLGTPAFALSPAVTWGSF